MFRTLSTAALLGLLTISAASAQNTSATEANIPFNFTVANHVMEAGTYRLTYNYTARVILIRGVQPHSDSAYVSALPASGSASNNHPGKLVFDCYGNACSLAEVLPVGGYNLQVGRKERLERMAMQTRVVPVLIAEK